MKTFIATLALSTSLAASAAGTVTTTIYIPGFQTYMASGYAPSTRNVERLAALNAAPASLRLVGFDAEKNNKNMLVCRASYPVSGGAVAGCADVTKALAAGVESFLNKLYSDPRFAELFAQ